jgi:hypothetical protein
MLHRNKTSWRSRRLVYFLAAKVTASMGARLETGYRIRPSADTLFRDKVIGLILTPQRQHPLPIPEG